MEADIFNFKFCLGCLKHGRWICDQCGRHFIPQLPMCYSCRTVSGGYITHVKCINKREYLTSLMVCFEYNRVIKRYVKYIKFKHSTVLLNEILIIALPHILTYIRNTQHFTRNAKECLLVPVPLYWLRYLNRGFNQSRIIAEAISKETGIDINNRCLKKIRNNRPQSEVKHKNRVRNTLGAFRFNSKYISEEVKHIILVDDIVTTGATLEECTKEIKAVREDIQIHAIALFRPKPKVIRKKLLPVTNMHKINP
ncbi:MAG: competence protein F [candidate division WS6 bacterium GW2011_GWF2_39_15]|uniref:Competence protein F n=1 Tax=candidate division WS6 bacterium GW2011_GWF2_39_15 TaxID=1619100 RepID=A0A0G0MYC3_9BACT|nr:MAG: competence protein F [candidate division WS6 bacterium GW2011_GWF2_39_15]